MKKNTIKEEILIYQWKNWEIILKEDTENDTIRANQKQISEIFQINQSVISRHIKNIFKDGEINEKCNMHFLHIANSDKPVKFYNLDIILAVWYRTSSSKAIEFRKWSTKILKEHITKWFTINPLKLEKNYNNFMKAVDEVKKILPQNSSVIKTEDILELVKWFANTWFNLDNYDRDELPTKGFTKKDLEIKSEELYEDVEKFKKDLIWKNQATELFAQEKYEWNLSWILWNIFQSFGWEDLYSTIEEKASHFLYFVVKNHPFNDWNKRTGAFCFIWFLKKAWFDFSEKITPEALTVITLLVAESNPKDKERIVWLIILLLKNN